ncbi:unnamed protein product [Cyprideis torosa]|uniref:Uncharacterized protein n=1 Tax=Cyprideis torosa TaxID=163714 RepID=A0A7R8WCR2_9CRUS|nr:unnamed protein product [Cyprideis torosa]CAG0891154.1 unnamed protein product [Cyprideis torosa]
MILEAVLWFELSVWFLVTAAAVPPEDVIRNTFGRRVTSVPPLDYRDGRRKEQAENFQNSHHLRCETRDLTAKSRHGDGTRQPHTQTQTTTSPSEILNVLLSSMLKPDSPKIKVKPTELEIIIGAESSSLETLTDRLNPFKKFLQTRGPILNNIVLPWLNFLIPAFPGRISPDFYADDALKVPSHYKRRLTLVCVTSNELGLCHIKRTWPVPHRMSLTRVLSTDLGLYHIE